MGTMPAALMEQEVRISLQDSGGNFFVVWIDFTSLVMCLICIPQHMVIKQFMANGVREILHSMKDNAEMKGGME